MDPNTSLSYEQWYHIKHRDAEDCSLVMLPDLRGWNDTVKDPAQKAEMSARAHTLQAGIALPFERKVEHARKVIGHALQKHPIDKWMLAYSGGKDSTVLSHLITTNMGDGRDNEKPLHVNSNTRMEYPQTVMQITAWFRSMRDIGVECHTVFPDVRPKELWAKIGVPLWSKMISYKYRKFYDSPNGVISKDVPANLVPAFHKLKAAGLRVTDKCCDELKKKPLNKFRRQRKLAGSFVGVRCAESRARRMTWLRFGSMYESTYHGKQWVCNPLAYWTEADVYQYLDAFGIRPLETPGARGGSGCVTCMFGSHIREQEGTNNTMQDLKVNNPKMYDAALDLFGYREVLDLLGIPY